MGFTAGVSTLLFLCFNVLALTHNNVSVGFDSACVVDDGILKCFGSNAYGHFGTSDVRSPWDNPVPVRAFANITNVLGVCMSLWHACLYTTEGDTFCAGSNGNFGLLGDNEASGASSEAPVKPIGLEGVTAKVACGSKHTCALLTSGAVRCWGLDDGGPLLNGESTENVLLPSSVLGFETGGAIDIEAGGFTTCVLTTQGGVMCGGVGNMGELGDGQGKNSEVLVQVSGLTSGFISISVGVGHVCALNSNHEVYCWGSNNRNIMMSNKIAPSLVPVLITALGNNVTRIASGFFNQAAILKDGSVRAWGKNDKGELGLGFTPAFTDPNLLGPTVVPGCLNVVDISLGFGPGSACLRTEDGSVYCSGNTGTADGTTNRFTKVANIGTATTPSTCVFTEYVAYVPPATFAPTSPSLGNNFALSNHAGMLYRVVALLAVFGFFHF